MSTREQLFAVVKDDGEWARWTLGHEVVASTDHAMLERLAKKHGGRIVSLFEKRERQPRPPDPPPHVPPAGRVECRMLATCNSPCEHMDELHAPRRIKRLDTDGEDTCRRCWCTEDHPCPALGGVMTACVVVAEDDE